METARRREREREFVSPKERKREFFSEAGRKVLKDRKYKEREREESGLK